MPLTPARPPATTIAVTSGKGGVGKTSLTINLAVSMARLGHRVGILDADFALGNIDVLLGLTPEHHLGAVLDGTKRVGDVMLEGPSGVRIIPAGSGVRELAALDEVRWARLREAIREAASMLDFLLIDTATGLTDNVLDLVQLADYVLVLTSYDPAAVVDAYAMIKCITAGNRQKEIGVVVNSASDAEQGTIVFRQISLAADRFLNRQLRYDGHVVEDHAVRDAGLTQSPLVGSDNPGPAGRCIRRLACKLVASRPSASGPWPGPLGLVPATGAAAGVGAPPCA
ncbi:MAG: MinD/ParA family protein [Vicinamibacterales bacterium]